MSHSIEKKDNNSAVITFEVDGAAFDNSLKAAYKILKNRINVPGFRKGKATMQIIEKMYGPEVFYDEAIQDAVSKSYQEFYEGDNGLEIVSRPLVDVGEVDRNNGFSFTATVATKPTAVLGKYLDVEVPIKKQEVSEEEIDKEIKKEIENNSRIYTLEDEAAKDGDICVIDFEGFVNEKTFEGGKGENHPLTLGSKSFIPGFEEQLVGHKAGEEVDVKVTFPENYHAEDLKGKEALFKCKIHEVRRKELPELNDEFVQEVSEFDTVDQYKNSIKEKIQERKNKDFEQEKENKLLKIIVDDSNADIHELMVNDKAEDMLEEQKQNLMRNGLSLEQYIQFTGLDFNKFKEMLKKEAEERIKTRLVLEAIVDAEKIEISDDECQKKLEELAKQYGMELEKLEQILSATGKDNMKEDMAIEKAIKLVMDRSKEVEPKEDSQEKDQ